MKDVSQSLQNLLNRVVNGRLDDFDVEADEGKLKGENFLGEIVFVSLRHKKTKESHELVIKRAIEGFNQTFTFLEDVHSKEITFYETVWPVLDKFQGDLGFNKIPKCYGSSRTKGQEIMVLENLNQKGFKLLDKTNTLNKEHIEYIFKTYAVYHAISYAFRELQPEEFSKLQNLINSKSFFPAADSSPEEKNTYNDFYRNSFKSVISLFDELTEKEILRAYKEFVKDDPDEIMRRVNEYVGDSPILTHGDCWSNNMMFKYDVSINSNSNFKLVLPQVNHLFFSVLHIAELTEVLDYRSELVT